MNMRTRRHRQPFPQSIRLPRNWRRRGLAALVLSLISACIVYERSAAPERTSSDHEKYHDRSFRVVHVVDGDTLHIDIPDAEREATRIRLWGVDTPETGHGNTTEMYFGPEAKTFAKDSLEGRTVHVILAEKKTRDKYDRLLAYVYLERGGVMFNELLMEEGFAYADRRFPHHYRDQFEAIESRARREKKGLWAGVKSDQMPPWRQRMDKSEKRDGP